MNVSVDVSWKSLFKHDEELCGDKVEVLKTEDSDIVILTDGMGSGVKANILATLAAKILGTMFLEGEPIEEAVETLASTLPICSVRGIAYSTFSILQIFHNGDAYLIEYDNPECVFIRDHKLMPIPAEVREIGGKKVREYRFKVQPDDCFVLMSDGTIYAGVGALLNLGWTWESMAEYTLKCVKETKSAVRIASMLSEACDELYQQRPGDDTTVAVLHVIEQKVVNILTGPPESPDMDQQMLEAFMKSPGKKVISGGTSAKIAAAYLGKEITNNYDGTKEVPPTSNIAGMDLVTEGILTLTQAYKLLRRFDLGDIDDVFFQDLDAEHGGAQLARMLLEECTLLKLYVGKAQNKANVENHTSFEISERKNIVLQLKEVMEDLGKQVYITYY